MEIYANKKGNEDIRAFERSVVKSGYTGENGMWRREKVENFIHHMKILALPQPTVSSSLLRSDTNGRTGQEQICCVKEEENVVAKWVTKLRQRTTSQQKITHIQHVSTLETL